MSVHLLVGNGGIGSAFRERALKLNPDEQIYAPDIDSMDVRYMDEVGEYISRYGPFKTITYTAGVNKLQWAREVTLQDMQHTFTVNVFGFISVMSAHLNAFPRHVGSAVAVSSDAGRIPMRTSVSYCSSKAALDMAVKCLARELAPHWRVNAVAPGIIAGTAMTEYVDKTVPAIRGWTPERAMAYEKSMIPMGRRGWPGEVARVITDLHAGPEYLTGSIVEISGGK